MNTKFKEILRFLITGGIATVIDFTIMSLFIYITCHNLFHNFFEVFINGKQLAPTYIVVIGTGLGFVISLIFNYILSCFYVFSNTEKAKTRKGFILFALLSLVGLSIHLIGMYIGYDLLGFNEWLIKIVLTLVVLVFNYITRKKIIFKEEKNDKN